MPGGGAEDGITGAKEMVGSGGNIFFRLVKGGGGGSWRGQRIRTKMRRLVETGGIL